MLVSTPAAIYGGALADDSETLVALIAEATRLATELQVDYLELRNAWDHQVGTRLKFWRKDLYVTFEQPIDADEGELLAAIRKRFGTRSVRA